MEGCHAYLLIRSVKLSGSNLFPLCKARVSIVIEAVLLIARALTFTPPLLVQWAVSVGGMFVTNLLEEVYGISRKK